MTKLIGANAAVETLENWSAIDGTRDAIERRYAFGDFKAAFAFMTAAALKAEQMDHHPEWFNVYSRVDVILTTHDANGVTQKDVELAQFMDKIFNQISS
ncbi:MAG: 4a-hydroxytetrahydrobiopterin dehydratase [Hyphomonas sp.]